MGEPRSPRVERPRAGQEFCNTVPDGCQCPVFRRPRARSRVRTHCCVCRVRRRDRRRDCGRVVSCGSRRMDPPALCAGRRAGDFQRPAAPARGRGRAAIRSRGTAARRARDRLEHVRQVHVSAYVGVNVVLAQTINTCLASAYDAPVYQVRSCIGRADDLISGQELLPRGSRVGAGVGARQRARNHICSSSMSCSGARTPSTNCGGRGRVRGVGGS